jgi:hypothetical protein
MRNSILLILGLAVLYLGISLALYGIYGPSYGFLQGEDCWIPDGSGGWAQHGHPADPAPSEPSREVPLPVQYLPILIPGLVLAAFLFTPLRRILEQAGVSKEPEAEDKPDDKADDSSTPA